jgi:hypothetical protein
VSGIKVIEHIEQHGAASFAAIVDGVHEGIVANEWMRIFASRRAEWHG